LPAFFVLAGDLVATGLLLVALTAFFAAGALARAAVDGLGGVVFLPGRAAGTCSPVEGG
jgi:hypothetical protein